MKQVETLIKEMGVKGVFIKEIKSRYNLLLKALIETGLELNSFGATFGIYKADVNFKDKEDLKLLKNLLEETNLKAEYKQKKVIVFSNDEIKPKLIKITVKKNIPYENYYKSFEDIKKVFDGLERDYKNPSMISFGTKYISFNVEEQRLETDNELTKRIMSEDKEYIRHYIEMSRKYEDYKKMQKIFEGYEE